MSIPGTAALRPFVADLVDDLVDPGADLVHPVAHLVADLRK